MKHIVYIFFLLSLLVGKVSLAQKIVYSDPEKDDTRRMNFEVIGKVGGNFQVYKNIRSKNYICIYDNDMKLVNKEDQDYLPSDRLINVDFFPYGDFSYVVYQYQRRNVVYCDAVKIDERGKKASDIIGLDTSHIGFATNNKIYTTLTSEDKNFLLIAKVNSKNKSRFLVSTLLFDNKLALQKRSAMVVPMNEQNDFLGDFSVDNEGDLLLTKFTRNNNDNISSASLLWKTAQSDSFKVITLPQEDIFLDELQVKVDNFNKRYLVSSFFYKQRRGNIEGLYFYVLDKKTGESSMQNTVTFSEELRKEARGDANIKMAFNDYFLRNIIIKRDGGFIVGSEAYYTTSRYNNWNRWDYLYGTPMSSFDYYTYSPLYSSWLWRNRYNNSQAVRHHADNITIFSFDNTGKLQWSNVIHKEQFDDETDDRISYNLVNTGGQLHYLFNMEERRTQLLNDYTLTADGQINRNPTLKNLDRGYEFLPKYGKQVSNRQMIIPCYYNNYICFAKLDYNL